MALAHVIDQNTDVEASDMCSETGVIGIVVKGCEIHGENVRLLTRILGSQFVLQCFELGHRSGDEEYIESFGSKLSRKLFAQTIRCTGNNGPCAFTTIFSELQSRLGLALASINCPLFWASTHTGTTEYKDAHE